MKVVFDYTNREKSYDDYFYDIFKDIEGYRNIFPKKIFENKDKYDELLYRLFEIIIFAGSKYYNIKKEADITLSESNFLKRDSNYYSILKTEWRYIAKQITDILDEFK